MVGKDHLDFSADEKKELAKYGIAALYLFGSRAQGVNGPMSDFDFAVLPVNKSQFAIRAYRNEIYDKLYDIFEKKIGFPCNIDIVFLNEATLQLQFHVIQQGKVIFETDANLRANYHERVMEAHADFEPLQHIFHKATLARI